MPLLADAQYLTKLTLTPDTQLVICLSPDPQPDEIDLVDLMLDFHEATYVSFLESPDNNRLFASKDAKPFRERGEKTVYLIKDGAIGAASCFPMSESQSLHLQRELDTQRQFERDVAPVYSEYAEVVEKSICQPVFHIALDAQNAAVVYRLSLDAYPSPPDCLDNIRHSIEVSE